MAAPDDATTTLDRFVVVPASYVYLLREELDVSADLHFEFTMQRTLHAEAIDERVDFFFTARSWEGEPRIVEGSKCAGLGWFPLDALPAPMVPHEAHALDHLGSGLGYLTFGF